MWELEELDSQLARAWLLRLMSNKAKTTTIKDGVEVLMVKIAGEIKTGYNKRTPLLKNKEKEIDDLVSLLVALELLLTERCSDVCTPLAQEEKG